MKKLLNVFLIAFFLFFSFSCGVKTSSINLKSSSQRPVLSPYQVKVFETANEISFPYIEIGIVSVKGSLVWTKKSKMEFKLKEEAGKMGANGLILESEKTGSLLGKGASVYFTGGIIGKKKISAVAVFVEYEKK